MSRPTPKEWDWRHGVDDEGRECLEVVSNYGTLTVIALVVPNDWGCRRLDADEARHNAVLLSAAPDLLGVIRDIAAWMTDDDCSRAPLDNKYAAAAKAWFRGKFQDDIERAVAKALGKREDE